MGCCFPCNCLGPLKTVYLINIPKGRDQSMDPIHPHGQVENATAPSAGGSPDLDGEVRLGKRRTFSDASRLEVIGTGHSRIFPTNG